MTPSRKCQWISGLGLIVFLLSSTGCHAPNWLINGFLDPTQVGNYLEPVRLEIRESLSILEEPTGIENTEEPTVADSIVHYDEQKIHPGDFVRITIFELVAPSQTTDLQIVVRNSGYETLPALGPVKIAGFTARELELDLKEKLREQEILEDADVRVAILQSSATQFTVVGQVPNPGNYPLPRPDYRLMNALAAAGGFSPQIKKIYLIRREGTEPSAIPQEQEETSGTNDDTETSIYSMSDFSEGGVSSSGPTSHSAQAATEPSRPSEINELEILEGKPQGRPVQPEYNAETGEWMIPTTKTQPVEAEETETQPTTSASQKWIRWGTSQEEPSSPEAESQPQEDLEPQVRIIEIETKPLFGGNPRYNVVIRPNDLINVPAGAIGEYYMTGNVARPGVFSLTGREITIKQAIVSAGGFSPLAWPSRADLIRRVSKDEEQIIQVDLDAIYSGKAPDFYLRPNDVLNVGSSPVAPFLAVLRNAFRFTYGFGFVYDRNFADKDSFGAKEQRKNRQRLEAQQRGLPF